MTIKMFVFRFDSHYLKKKVFKTINYSAIYLCSFGTRPNCANCQKMNRRWICNDVWMDIFPCFDRPQLGLKLALLSPRFNALVDKHFNGKSELTIWRTIKIRRNNSVTTTTAVPESSVIIDFDNSVPFPLPDRPLPSKIRFKRLHIRYIDHFIIAFLRSNHQIFDKRGTNLQFSIPSSNTTDGQRIWDVFVREIWPVFAPNIRHLGFVGADHLDNLRRLISPTILIYLNQLNSIDLFGLLPVAFGDDFDGPNAIISAGQALSKWLHSPRKDGQPKRLRCALMNEQANFNWLNNLKEHFLRANAISSVSYKIHFSVRPSMQIVPFELVNEWTKEKLTLTKANENKWQISWIMKRCKIVGETAAVNWEETMCSFGSFLVALISLGHCLRHWKKKTKRDKASQMGRRLLLTNE